MNREQLERKIETLVTAQTAVINELKRLYPTGTQVRCWLQEGQVNPSRGEVIGHHGGAPGYVLVRLESRKRETRSVPAEKILD